jgi:uncharacterized membrane protein
MFKKLNQKKGQSTLEYIILVAGVVAVLLVFLAGTFRTDLQQTYQDFMDVMDDMATRLSDSRAVAP